MNIYIFTGLHPVIRYIALSGLLLDFLTFPRFETLEKLVVFKKMKNSYKYEIIIYWSKEDEALIAEVPELAGCQADGETYQQALANVEVVIDEWIETAKLNGREIPPPKGRLMYT